MESPTLYYDPISAPCRAILLLLEELDLKINLKFCSLVQNEHMNSEFLKKNVMHTLPTLEDDGNVIVDSHVIMSYLVSKYGKNDDLYPKDLLKRALVDQRMFFDNGSLWNCGIAYVKRLKSEGKNYLTENERDEILKQYTYMENFLGDNLYMAGNSLTICDISLFSTCTSYHLIVNYDEKTVPKYNKWVKRMEKLRGYGKIVKKHMEDFANFIVKAEIVKS